MDTGTLTVNFVVWAENCEAATALAQSLAETDKGKGVFEGQVEGQTLNAYIRYPGIKLTSSPKGITDVLIVKLSGKECPSIEEAKKYLNPRRSIPIKIFTGADDLQDLATEYGAELCEENTLITSDNKCHLVRRAKDLDDTLKAAFNKIDLNGNGFLTADELVQAAHELGYVLNTEEAKQIGLAISKDGEIPYNKFKSWWIQGKGDFSTFRRLVQVEMSVNNLVKKGSMAFNKYIEKIEQESHVENADRKGYIDFGPSEEFESGMALLTDLSIGNDFTSLVNDLPDYFKNNVLTASFEVYITNPTIGPQMIEGLEKIKEKAMEVPKVQEIFNLGFEVAFRHLADRVCIDISLGGLLAEMFTHQLFSINVDAVNFAGVSSVQMTTGLRPTDILKCNMQQLLEKACSLKFQSNASFTNSKVFLEAVYQGLLEREDKKDYLLGLKLLSGLTVFNTEFKYDVKALVSLIQDMFAMYATPESPNKLEELTQQLGGFQMMSAFVIGGAKAKVTSLLEEYGFSELVKSINFDRITIAGCLPFIKLYHKMTYTFPGVTDFISEKILEQTS